MTRYIIGRLLKMVPIVLGITLLTFLLTRLSPGDPAINALGLYATPDRIAAYRQEFGLDQPLFNQYLVYLLNLLQGDLGYSVLLPAAGAGFVLGRLGPEIVLITYAIALSLVIGVPVAVVAGLRRGGKVDRIVSSSIVVRIACRPSGSASSCCWSLAVWIPIFPVGGFGEGILGPPRRSSCPP